MNANAAGCQKHFTQMEKCFTAADSGPSVSVCVCVSKYNNKSKRENGGRFSADAFENSDWRKRSGF